jgi:uncharacterized protein (TIGR03435 family)
MQNWMRTTSWIAAGLLCVVVTGAKMPAQDAAGGRESKPAMMAKDADPDWDVVTVKPSDPASQYGGYQVEGRDVLIRRKTVQSMLLYAYTLHKSQLGDVPDWVRTELWDAKGYADAAGQPNREQMQSLVRKLLKERFGLVMHMEQHEASIYMLTVARGGARMAISKGDPNGLSNENDRENGGLETMHAENLSMSELSGLLMRIALDRPAVDMTDLKGRYDFELRWTTDDAVASASADAPPGLFTAIQEQLGLRLEPVKAMADVLIVDKVERPGAN